MKTILSNDGNVSKYLLADDKAVAVSAGNIVVGDPSAPDFIIGDMNSSNATVVEGVTTPDDWFGCKYTYADSTWTVIEGWVDPRLDDGE
jgi:hypothetical protein